MIAQVQKSGGYWVGFIIDEEDNQILYSSTKMERRAGCAFKTLLNGWQSQNGEPNIEKFELNVDEW